MVCSICQAPRVTLKIWSGRRNCCIPEQKDAKTIEIIQDQLGPQNRRGIGLATRVLLTGI